MAEHNHSSDKPHDNSHAEHQHAPANPHGKAFMIAVSLNIAFVMIESIYGVVANSTALLADAGHNLSDVLGLLVAWGASLLANKTPNNRFTYGLRSSSILAALFNAVILLVACGGIAWEAIQRFSNAHEVAGLTVTIVASIGIAINGLSAMLFLKGSKEDLNIRGAYLHLAADAAVSFGVVLSGLAIMATGWHWIDPLTSLIVTVVIIYGTWGLLRESATLALQAIPAHIDALAIENHLKQYPGVTNVHDMHIWALSTTETALTAHLVMPLGLEDVALDALTSTLRSRFGIDHSTLQIERGAIHACTLNPTVQHHDENI